MEPPQEDPSNTIALHLERNGAVLVLQVEGPLSVEQVGALRAMFDQMWKQDASQMVIDLAACPFTDSAGLAALISAFEQARKLNRGFLLVGVRPQLRNLMQMNRLDQVMETQPTVEKALVN
jgi:anti-sigma B factor antagonist